MILWFHHYSVFSEVNALAQHHDPLATAVGEIAQMVSIPSTQIKVAVATDFINGQKAVTSRTPNGASRLTKGLWGLPSPKKRQLKLLRPLRLLRLLRMTAVTPKGAHRSEYRWLPTHCESHAGI